MNKTNDRSDRITELGNEIAKALEHLISKCAKCGANTFAYSEFVKCDCGQKVYLGRYDNNLCYGCGKIYNRLGQEITLGASKKLLKQALEKEMQRLSSYVPQGKEKGEEE